MGTWSVHHLYQKAEQTLAPEQAVELQRYAHHLGKQGLAVVFSLGHLAKICGVDYAFLRETVDRRRDAANYRMFAITKRSGGRRFIHAVGRRLLGVQRFINEWILQKTYPHPSSYAFHPDGGIAKCAAQHCGARWLFQFDLADFFYSIPEFRVYGAFQELGYRYLLAFELARLCTTTHLPKRVKMHRSTRRFSMENSFFPLDENAKSPPYASQWHMGVLPQGAPTSPMLSNLVARKLDEALEAYSLENNFVYTRYADDLTFSCTQLPDGKSIPLIRRTIIGIIRENGFYENTNKIRIAGPGSRKMVLGLLIDGDRPRLSKQMRARLDRLIYSVEQFGLTAAASHFGFESAYGFYNHISGLIAYTKDVDHSRWMALARRWDMQEVPL